MILINTFPVFQKIQKLNIGYCNQVSARIIADVVNSASNIQYLNLQRTKCNDQVLSLIGHKLHNIKELIVSSCPITDMGIMSLCVNFDPSFVKCGKLLKLDINNTAVTHKGAQRAVEHLQNLAWLDFPDICDVIHRTRKDCVDCDKDELPKEQELKLRLLTISQMKEYAAPIYDTVRVSVLACPLVTEVNFISGASDKCVRLLSSLEHLRALHLGNSDVELITFEGGILPMLTERGATLLDFSLHEVNKIDIGAIAACCPNLKKFSCIVAGYPTAEFPVHTHPELIMAMKHPPFAKLEHVKVLIHSPENTFPPQYVKLLTVKALKLQSLHFAYVQSLDDTVLNFILDENSFKNLEACYLESCNRLTGDGIRRLIQLCEVMKSLSLKYCNEITRQDFSDYLKFRSDNNYEMDIDWS